MKSALVFTLAGLMVAALSQRLPAQHVFGAALTPDAAAGRKPATSIPLDQIGAVYPVRIDPSFSDANWINIGGIPGANGKVYATAMDGAGNLYIGGSFTNAGGVLVNNIAKWNGSSWSALGPPGIWLSCTVYALAVSGSDLYIGGCFSHAGGITANYVAKWNGSTWSSLGSGMNDSVTVLAVSGSDLYAGGWFTTAGGNTANYIAKWDGTNWSALGSGMGKTDVDLAYPYVYALAVSGSDLYAGGWFTTAGGSTANYVAKWNGSSWSALGSGVAFFVNGLAVSGSDLYAGGWFTNAGYVVKWNGNSWSRLGSGVNDAVWTLAVSGTDLYVGGKFTTAGGNPSDYVARARIGSIATSLVATRSTASIQFSGVTGYQYDVQRTTNLDSPITWTTVTTSPLSPADDGSFTFIDSNAPLGMAYYRAEER